MCFGRLSIVIIIIMMLTGESCIAPLQRFAVTINQSRTSKDIKHNDSTNHVPAKTSSTVIQQITYHQRRKPQLFNESRTTKDAYHCYSTNHVPPKTKATVIQRITYHQKRRPLLFNESRGIKNTKHSHSTDHGSPLRQPL